MPPAKLRKIKFLVTNSQLPMNVIHAASTSCKNRCGVNKSLRSNKILSTTSIPIKHASPVQESREQGNNVSPKVTILSLRNMLRKIANWIRCGYFQEIRSNR